jgi:hypothetical protein
VAAASPSRSRSAFTPSVDTTEELHTLLSTARLLQLLSSASAALCPTSTPAALKLGLATSNSTDDSLSSDDACIQVPEAPCRLILLAANPFTCSF